MLKLLYVDDDPDLRDLAMFALELDQDIEARFSASGLDALLRLAEDPADVVLLDVMMPEMDGPAVLAALRRQPGSAATQVVFVTARALPDDRVRLMALGATDVITKPFDPMTFAADVRRIVSGADAR